MSAISPPDIFSKEVAKNRLPYFPVRTFLTAGNRFRPNFRGWRLNEFSIFARPPPGGPPAHAAFELSKDAQRLKHGLACWRGRTEALLMQKQVDAKRVKLGQECHKVFQAAAQAIDVPGHHYVELALGGARYSVSNAGRPLRPFRPLRPLAPLMP